MPTFSSPCQPRGTILTAGPLHVDGGPDAAGQGDQGRWRCEGRRRRLGRPSRRRQSAASAAAVEAAAFAEPAMEAGAFFSGLPRSRFFFFSPLGPPDVSTVVPTPAISCCCPIGWGLLPLLLLVCLGWVVTIFLCLSSWLTPAPPLLVVARCAHSWYPPAVTRVPLTAQDEVLTALHWVRQAYGVGVGLLFGLLGVTGAVGAIAYLFSCFVLTTGYVYWEGGWVASWGGGELAVELGTDAYVYLAEATAATCGFLRWLAHVHRAQGL